MSHTKFKLKIKERNAFFIIAFSLFVCSMAAPTRLMISGGGGDDL